jgi:benzil reductase ((S)-benzoin forming)
MTMKAFIITGTSRGIGEAMAEQLLSTNNKLYCIARNRSKRLEGLASKRQAQLNAYSLDLSELTESSRIIEEVLCSIKQEKELEGIYLINNAGMLSPVKPIEQCHTEEIIGNVTVNLLAPMVLTSRFIDMTKELGIDKRVMNVSSGSAKYLLPSQSCYSTAKAGLDSFTKSIYLEQQHVPNPVKVTSVYPGMINTALQAEIRSTNKDQFAYVDQFIKLEQDGLLQTPEYTATKLIELLLSEQFGEVALIEQI